MEFKKIPLKVLRFLQLVDRAGNLSITNIAVIVLITKMAIAPFDWATAAGLMVTLLNYSHKRAESAKAERESTKVVEIQAINGRVEELNKQIDQFKSTHEEISKQAEATKKLLSQQNLQSAFQTPNRNRNRE